jgi:hypothetical protein
MQPDGFSRTGTSTQSTPQAFVDVHYSHIVNAYGVYRAAFHTLLTGGAIGCIDAGFKQGIDEFAFDKS